jgi:hypothetical protein
MSPKYIFQSCELYMTENVSIIKFCYVLPSRLTIRCEVISENHFLKLTLATNLGKIQPWPDEKRHAHALRTFH